MQQAFKPQGYTSASPYFIAHQVDKLVHVLEGIFNTKTLRRYDMPDGTIMHIEIQLDDSVLMLGEASEKFPPVPIVMHVYVPNVDDTFKKAIALGCEVVEPPKQREGDPDRRGTFKDFAGNMWSVATALSD